MKIKRICQWCNKEFEVYASSLQSSNSSGKFCCRKCYNEYQRTLTGKKNNHSTRIAIKCAREYIVSVGGFERFAEWGLF